MSLLDHYDALLLDLDGTVWAGGDPIPGAVDVINSCGLPSIYITNNASKAPQEVAMKLNGIGLPVSSEHVLTSAQAAISLAADKIPAGSKVLVVGADSFRQLAQEAGYTIVHSADDDPAAVFQGFAPTVDWAQLTEAALAVRKGATYIASNLDTSLPMERGLAVGNGSLVAAVTSATGIKPVSAGKPESAMFTQASEIANATRPLAVGDRLDTDIQGGNAAAIDTFHVLTGVSGPMALIEAVPEQRPEFIGADMRDLSFDSHTLRPGAQGGFTARLDGMDLLLENGDEGATSLQALRTVLEVVWAMNEPPRYIHPRSDVAEKATGEWW